jgi:hypothetical protein
VPTVKADPERKPITMTGMSLLHAIFSFLCILFALFFCFRLVSGCRWVSHFDAENEVGHGMMAIGMLFMLAPAGWLSDDMLSWNLLVFAAASLWWTCRLFARKPLLALLLKKSGAHSPVQSTVRSDVMQVFMHGSMCYLFLLMRSMVWSMTQAVTDISCLLLVAFAFLTLFSSHEISQDLQAPSMDWLQLGAHLTHVLMSGMMCWMFLEMITMTIAMKG